MEENPEMQTIRNDLKMIKQDLHNINKILTKQDVIMERLEEQSRRMYRFEERIQKVEMERNTKGCPALALSNKELENIDYDIKNFKTMFYRIIGGLIVAGIVGAISAFIVLL